MGDFDGRIALVTGGASGIGAAAVALLRERGAAGRRRSTSTPARARGRAAASRATSTDSAQVDDAVARVERELGPLDALVCCAGDGGDSLHTVDIGDEEWRRVFAINLDGVFYFNRAAARVMAPRGYGRIVNVASIAGKEGNPMAAAYSASKAAVIGMTKSVGKDLADDRRARELHRARRSSPRRSSSSSARSTSTTWSSRIPMGRMGRPEEVAELIAFLASDRMTFSTGATFDISGGRAVLSFGRGPSRRQSSVS